MAATRRARSSNRPTPSAVSVCLSPRARRSGPRTALLKNEKMKTPEEFAMQRRMLAAATALIVVLAPGPCAAAELPKSTQKALTDLKLDASLLDGLDAELNVPKEWIEAAKQEKEVIVTGTWQPREFQDMT